MPKNERLASFIERLGGVGRGVVGVGLLIVSSATGCVQCDFELADGCFVSEKAHVTPEAAAEGLRLAEQHWGSTISLKHYEVYFTAGPRVECDGTAVGCTCNVNCSWIKIGWDPDVPCGIGFVFLHELGHVLYPKLKHDDPRFWSVMMVPEIMTVCERFP